MSYRVYGVSREILPALWPTIEPLLRPALDRDATVKDTGDVFDALDRETCALWAVMQGEVLVGVLVLHLEVDRLVVWLMGGYDFDKWHEVVEPLLVRYAEEAGVPSVQANVRPGLGRKLGAWRKRSELVELRVEGYGRQEQAEDAHDHDGRHDLNHDGAVAPDAAA